MRHLIKLKPQQIFTTNADILTEQIWEWTGPRYNNLITKQVDHLNTKILLKTKTLLAHILLIKHERLSESCTDLAPSECTLPGA